MAEQVQLNFGVLPQERSRPALLTETNAPYPTAAILQTQQIRRKSSFIHRIDSSEDQPSSHESIFEAEYVSNVNSEDSGQRLDSRPTTTANPLGGIAFSSMIAHNDENARERPIYLSVVETPILYGHGTPLATIIEQKSATTMRTTTPALSRPRFTPDFSSCLAPATPRLAYCDSMELLSTSTMSSPRRRNSFSADDLELIKRSYHDACTTIARNARRAFPVDEIYAQPRRPVVPPPNRPGTPPGMPSWTAAQIAPRNTARNQVQATVVNGTTNRLQRFFRIQPRSLELASRVPVTAANIHSSRGPRDEITRTVSRPLPGSTEVLRYRPFRPPRSGYGTGPLDHPFLRAGLANRKSNDAPTTSGLSPQAVGSSARAVRSNAVAGKRGRKQVQRARSLTSRRAPNDSSAYVREGNASVPPEQCHHRRGRIATMRNLSSSIQVPESDPSIARYTALPNNIPREVAQFSNEPPLVAEQSNLNAIDFPTCPLISSTIEQSPSPNAVPTSSTPRLPVNQPTIQAPIETRPLNQQCWRCRVSFLFDKIDDIWDNTTHWCCWYCCGVDMDDNDDLLSAGIGREALLRPRRVLLDGDSVIV